MCMTAYEYFLYSTKYCAMAHIEQNLTTVPHGWIDIALRPETDLDARETALWLKGLFHRIYREVC